LAQNNSLAAELNGLRLEATSEKAKVALLEEKFSSLMAERDSLASECDRLRVELDGMRSVKSLEIDLKVEILKLKEVVAIKDKNLEDNKASFEMETAGHRAQNDRLEKDLVDMLNDRMQDIEEAKNACLATVDAKLSMTKMMKSMEDMKKENYELRSQLNK
jgi:hypothetical protein